MDNVKFIVAKLLDNEIGAMYQGYVWNRWLTIELPNGKIVKIFDLRLLSENLVIGMWYEFILFPLTFDKKYMTKRDTFVIEEVILDWSSIGRNFLVKHESLDEGSFSVIRLDGVGCVLETKELPDVFETDDKKIKIVCGRFDLYGVRQLIS
ncbi:MAG: hypothetical protein KJ043_08320 [Anaerolineae bacterium]|nr:hypothetical protein [Anaerolineae bacterium]